MKNWGMQVKVKGQEATRAVASSACALQGFPPVADFSFEKSVQFPFSKHPGQACGGKEFHRRRGKKHFSTLTYPAVCPIGGLLLQQEFRRRRLAGRGVVGSGQSIHSTQRAERHVWGAGGPLGGRDAAWGLLTKAEESLKRDMKDNAS